MSKWPMTPLGKVASPVQRPEIPVPGKPYRQVGVRLWGEGAYERELLDGGGTKYKTLSRVETDDIVVNKIWARNGSVAVVSGKLAGCYVSGEFPTFKPSADRIAPRWFHWLTKTPSFWEQCDNKSRGTSGKNRIRPERFLEIEIPLPPLPEQRRIVARIESLFAKVEESNGLRQQTNKEAYALYPSALEKVFECLVSTCSSKGIGQLCEVVRGGSPRPAGSPLYYGGPIPFIKVGDITKDGDKYLYEASGSVNELGKNQSRFIEVGTLMLTNSGATLGVPKITRIAGCFNDGSQAFLNLDPSVDKEFLYYFFKSKTRWFRERVARGQGQPNLNTEMTRQMAVPVPPLSEQHRIVAHLDGLQVKVDELKKLQSETTAELAALMPSILDKAFKGEL